MQPTIEVNKKLVHDKILSLSSPNLYDELNDNDKTESDFDINLFDQEVDLF